MQIEQNSTVIALCFLRTNDAQAPREEEDKNGKRRTDGRRDCLNLDIFPILPHRFIFVIILSLSASRDRPPFRTVLQNVPVDPVPLLAWTGMTPNYGSARSI